MNKKIMLLALAAVSATVLALPAMASASIPLHLNPTPAGQQQIDGGPLVLSSSGSTIVCSSSTGGLSFESGGTTGTMELTASGCSTFGGLVSCRSTVPEEPLGKIQTTPLPFHLVILPNNKPGMLVTPNASESFAHLNCGGVLFTVTGNGVIGTIEQACSSTSSRLDVNFVVAGGAGNQEHKKVAFTETVWDLKKGAETLALAMTETITLTQSAELQCT